MKKFVLAQILFLIIGCSSGIIVHDQSRAAELVVDFLTGLKSAAGTKLAYEWTDDKYKDEVSFSEFTRMVSSIRNENLGADIRLIGYEVFGAKESIVVYAKSETNEGAIYFRFSLVGTKTRDYYLLNLSRGDSEFSKEGIYREYGEAIVVQGV